MKTVIALLLLVLPAVAAAKKKPADPVDAKTRAIEAKFTKLDSNKDGKLSFAEFKEMVPASKEKAPAKGKKKDNAPPAPDLAGVFTTLDANRDNALTLTEFKKLPDAFTAAPAKSKKAK